MQFTITDLSLTTQVGATFTATRTKMPKALGDALARASRLTEATRTLGAPEGAIGAAVTAALDDGRDPAADGEVQRLLTATQLSSNYNLPDEIAAAATDQVREVCRDHADEIVETWTKPFDQAALALAAAHQRIGSVPLEDTTTIMALGGDAAEVWAQAQAAVATIDATVTGWSALASFTRNATANPRRRVLILADVDYATWCTLERHNQGPWDALLAGLPLSLPTFAEYRKRTILIDEAQAQAQPATAPPHAPVTRMPIRRSDTDTAA